MTDQMNLRFQFTQMRSPGSRRDVHFSRMCIDYTFATSVFVTDNMK